MKTTVIGLIVMLFSLPLAAQSQWKPWIIAEGGILWGAYDATGDLRLQGGMKTNGWLIGAGTAYDPYRIKSVPVYVQARKMLTKWRAKPFALASIGANLEVEKDQTPVVLDPGWGRWADPAYQYSNGIYAEGGLGLALRVTETFGINISLSYSRKTNTESYNSYTWAGSNPEISPIKNKYLMNRLVFRLGFQF